MSKQVVGAVVAVTLLVAAGFITLVYPFIYRDPLAEPFLEIDDAEEKAWLDSQIVIEIRGSVPESEVRESLEIHPPVPVREEDVVVEHIAKFPWHERFPWAKTRVTINPHNSRLFEPETSYTVTLKGENLTFETITLPRVADAYVGSVLHNDFKNVPTSLPICGSPDNVSLSIALAANAAGKATVIAPAPNKILFNFIFGYRPPRSIRYNINVITFISNVYQGTHVYKPFGFL